MDDVEMGPLAGADTQFISQDPPEELAEERVPTNVGFVTVGILGNKKKPAIITFHDLGLNANSCFQSFFQFSDMAGIADRFCVYHINAPGQEEGAPPLSDSQTYPTTDELAQVVVAVVDHFQMKNLIGLGVGAGANILCRYAIKNPKKVEALILINCALSSCGWMEWGYQKMNVSYLKSKGMTNFTRDYLMWHHFGKHQDHCNPDLVHSYRQYFSKLPHPANLAGFIESYIRRSPIPLSRDGQTIQCPVLQIVGAGSPHLEGTIDFNSRLDPSTSNWLKISDCSGLVLEEMPDKATEAILLFIQGLGYFPSMSHVKWVKTRQNSVVMEGGPLGPRSPESPPPAPQSPDQTEDLKREVVA